jgi:predicted RNA-binding Zn-ribbon protein involved in translation (DUF1610 family)
MSGLGENVVFHCPRCGAELTPEAEMVELDGDGAELPVYSCPACVVAVELFGETFPAALTFAVRGGRPFDPAGPDGELPPPYSPPAPSR